MCDPEDGLSGTVRTGPQQPVPSELRLLGRCAALSPTAHSPSLVLKPQKLHVLPTALGGQDSALHGYSRVPGPRNQQCQPRVTRTLENRPALPKARRVPSALSPGRGEGAHGHGLHRRRGEAGEGSTALPPGASEPRSDVRKRLTLFNVNVSCLLPTVVSDTFNVPFFASSFSRSSRVLL